MTCYIFGDPRLVARHFSDDPALVPLRLWHLPRLGPEDVIVTPRPWSPMLEAMLFWRNARRPRIVQVADGIAFDINARKRKNQRYGGLQRHVFADVFLALQNIEDFDLICDEPGMIRSGTVIETAPSQMVVDGSTAVLVAGNDPFFDFDPGAVVAAFGATAYRLRGLRIEKLLLSCPDQRLREALLATQPGIEPIGKLIDHPGDTNRMLLVGSPSTVLVDHMRRGGAALLIDLYEDPVLTRYLDLETALDTATRGEDGDITLTAQGILHSETQPMALETLLATLPRRTTETLPREKFGEALRIRLLIRELHLALGGAHR